MLDRALRAEDDQDNGEQDNEYQDAKRGYQSSFGIFFGLFEVSFRVFFYQSSRFY